MPSLLHLFLVQPSLNQDSLPLILVLALSSHLLHLFLPLCQLFLPLFPRIVTRSVFNHQDRVVFGRMSGVGVFFVYGYKIGSGVGNRRRATNGAGRGRGLEDSTELGSKGCRYGGPTATDTVRYTESFLPCCGSDLVPIGEPGFFNLVIVIWSATDICRCLFSVEDRLRQIR